MKRDVVLLIDADADNCGATEEAARTAIEKFAQTPGVHRCRSDEWGRLCEGCDRSRGKVEKDYALFAEEY